MTINSILKMITKFLVFAEPRIVLNGWTRKKKLFEERRRKLVKKRIHTLLNSLSHTYTRIKLKKHSFLYQCNYLVVLIVENFLHSFDGLQNWFLWNNNHNTYEL